MVEKIFERIAKVQEKYPVEIIIGVLAVIGIALLFAVELKTDPSFNAVLPDDAKYNIMKRSVVKEFGVTDNLFILIDLDLESDHPNKVRDVRDPRILQLQKELHENMIDEEVVIRTSSLHQLYLAYNGQLPETLEEAKAISQQFPEDQLAFFANSDFTKANFFIEAKVGERSDSIANLEQLINGKIEEQGSPPGVSLTLGGLPTLLKRILNLLIDDNLKTVLLALSFVFIVLLIYYRNFVLSLISLIPALGTLAYLAGTMSFFGIQINFAIAAVGAMMVGIGVDYAIHITHEYLHELEVGSKQPLATTMHAMGGALTSSALTTFVGFIAMTAGQTPSTQTQGIVLSLGIFFTFISSLTLMPPLLVLYSKTHDKPQHHKNGGLQRKMLHWLAHQQTTRPWRVIGAVFLLTILIIPGLGLVRMDTDNENWIPDDDPIAETFQEIGDNFGGTDTLSFIISIDPENEGGIRDVRDPEVMKPMAQLAESLRNVPYVRSVQTVTDDIKRANNDVIPGDIGRIKEQIEQDEQLRTSFNEDYTYTRFSIFSPGFGNSDPEQIVTHNDILAHVSRVNFPDDVKVELFGDLPRFLELGVVLQQDTGLTTLLGFIGVFIVSAVLYGSLIIGALTIIPVIVALIWSVAFMGYFSVPFTVLSSGILALTLGLGVDYSIHLTNMFRYRRRKGDSLEKAVERTMSSTGGAIVTATFTTFLGFLSLAFATLLGTKRLGYALAICIICVFMLSMLVVPSILVLKEKWSTRK